jgi:cysteine desulfurase / selenocysteine lyase
LSVPTQADVSLASIRQVEFAAAAGAAYFNHASDSPLPRRAARVMAERIALLENPLATVPAREEYLARSQQHLGCLIGGEPEQIAFLTNAADATSIVANGIDWRPGDEVIIVAGEFASFVYPWKALDRRGVEIKIVAKEGVATRYDDIVAAITPRTRLLAISHVEYQSGFRHDLAALGALCRGHDLLFVVDASQSLGVLPVDASMNGVDVVVSVGYKWLMAPHGIGVLYVAPAAMERIAPSAPGRYSVAEGWQTADYALNWHPDARRYQGGALNWIGVCALAESTGLLDEIGLERVGSASRAVTDRIAAGLDGLPVRITSDLRDAHRSAILTFTFGLEEIDEAFAGFALESGVVLGRRAYGIRIGAHFWNDESDVTRLIETIERFADASLHETLRKRALESS